MQAALAENAFARLNFEALIDDGSKASFAGPVATAFRAAVYIDGGEARIDYDLLLASGILAPQVTAERLRDVLRFDAGPAPEQRTTQTAASGSETSATPRARPLGWTTLGDKVPVTDSGQPTQSGWYLRVRLAWPDRKFPKPLGSHSAFGYYDAATKHWGVTSSLDYEYDPESAVPTPGIGGEMALESSRHKVGAFIR